MVLESLINPMKAEREPWELFFIGLVYSSVAILLSLWIFSDYASLVMVFLTVIACIPLIFNTIKMEEEKDLVIEKERLLLKEHGRAISFFVFLFLGIMLSITLWYVLIPVLAELLPSVIPADLHQNLFSIQSETISGINDKMTGNTIQETGFLFKIFLNNFKVLLFCILFAFLYGAGAIFILTWNASVIGVAIGNFILTHVSQGLPYINVTSLGILRYMIHGIPEIVAYFVAGLAGGIISVAVIRHDFGSKKFEHILLDSTDLIIISVVLLFFAAIIEVYITPILF